MEVIRGKIIGPKKTVIYGTEGIGKSTFASQFPNPIFIDTEGSTKDMDVARTPRPTSWTMLLQQIQYYKQNPYKYNTLVIDTADWAERLCIEHICSKSQKSGIEDFGYGKGYTYLEEEFGRFLNSLEDIIEVGMNVTVTAHAWMRKFEQPDELGAYDRWELKLEKKTAPLLKEWADAVLFANYKTYVVNVDGQGIQKGKNKGQGGKRVMYTSHHPCWDAKNRWGLEPELAFDYNSITHCIFKREGNQVQQPTQQQVTIVNQTAPKEVQQATVTVPPVQQTKPVELPKVNTSEPLKDDLKGIPKALADLMKANNVTVEEIQDVVSNRGYYPVNTPIENYDPNFITGVLVGAWGQVFKMIEDSRDIFTPVTDNDEIPF